MTNLSGTCIIVGFLSRKISTGTTPHRQSPTDAPAGFLGRRILQMFPDCAAAEALSSSLSLPSAGSCYGTREWDVLHTPYLAEVHCFQIPLLLKLFLLFFHFLQQVVVMEHENGRSIIIRHQRISPIIHVRI